MSFCICVCKAKFNWDPVDDVDDPYYSDQTAEVTTNSGEK